MTKLRAPDSVEDGMMQAIGVLGAETISMALAARLQGRKGFSASLMRKWADPEVENRIDMDAALEIDRLLTKSGHQPVFKPLFDRACEPPAAYTDDEAAANPLADAIKAAAGATRLLEDYHAKSADGLDWYEIVQLRAKAQDIMKRLARLVRALVVKPKGQRARKP